MPFGNFRIINPFNRTPSAPSTGTGDGDLTFDGDRPITRGVSGLNNLTPGGETVKEFLENLFYPAVPATISAGVSPSSGERGNAISVTASATVHANDHTIMGVNLLRGGSVVASAAAVQPGNSGSISHVFGSESETFSFTAEAARLNNGPLTTSRTIQFYDPYYIGVMEHPTILAWSGSTVTRAQAGLVTSRVVAGRGTRSASFSPSGERIVFAYPASHGLLGAITDPNGYAILSAFDTITFTYVRADGVTVAYRMYYSDADLNLSNFTVQFSF